jgi:hypothetical protein
MNASVSPTFGRDVDTVCASAMSERPELPAICGWMSTEV